jgi:HK97 family phage portal protein
VTFLRELVSIRSLENGAVPLTDDSLRETLGAWPSDTGVSVSPEGALRIGAALRGVQIIAGTVGGLDLRAYRHRDREPFLGSVLDADSAYGTRFELWETAVAHMVTRGFAALYKVRDGRGTITDLIPVHPGRVSIQVVDLASYKGWDLIFFIDGKGPFTRYEILYIPMMSLDGIHGLGPIAYARETFALAAANNTAAAKLFGQGMMQRGFLTSDADIDNEKAERLKSRWRAKMGGLDNAHDVAILDNGAKFQALTLDPVDAQFLESRKFSVTEIARLLGLPGWMLNDQEKATSWGTGMETMFTTWVKVTLNAVYLRRIAARVTKEVLPQSAFAEHQLDGLLRGDSAARATFYNAGITGGWLVPNDVRPKENLPKVPWGDEPYRPFNEPAAPAPTDGKQRSDLVEEIREDEDDDD